MRKSECDNWWTGSPCDKHSSQERGRRVQESEHQGMRLSGHEVLSKGQRKGMRVQKRE